MRFSLTCLVLLVVYTANAQIEKKTIVVGGSVAMNYKSFSKTGEKEFNFSVAPSVGFIVAKNFQIGPEIGYKLQSIKHSFGTTDNTHDGFVGIGLKYYLKIGNNAYVHFAGALAAEFGSEFIIKKNRGLVWEAGPGLTLFVTKTVAIEIAPRYQGEAVQTYLKVNGNIDPKTVTSAVNHGFFLNVGFSIFIPRKSVEK